MRLVRSGNRVLELLTRVTWPAIGAVFLVLYALGAVVFEIVEPDGTGFRSLADYSWWFFVTITTVGYGDLAPTTYFGRLTAAFIMVFGISTIGVVLGKVGEGFFEIGRNRMRGLSQVREQNHIVIFGYNAGETERTIEEIVADESWSKRAIVLVSNTEEENPIPDRVAYVRGALSSDDVMQRACVTEAAVILIQSHEDHTTIVTAIAANAVNPRAHIVVKLVDAESEKHIRRINPAIECVVPLGVPLTVQAIQDPGITRVMQQLVSNVHDDVMYRAQIPEAWSGRRSFGELLEILKARYEVILVGVASRREGELEIDINPGSDFEIVAGTTLFYIGRRRLEGTDWLAQLG